MSNVLVPPSTTPTVLDTVKAIKVPEAAVEIEGKLFAMSSVPSELHTVLVAIIVPNEYRDA